jgi:hypothetical protein
VAYLGPTCAPSPDQDPSLSAVRAIIVPSQHSGYLRHERHQIAGHATRPARLVDLTQAHHLEAKSVTRDEHKTGQTRPGGEGLFTPLPSTKSNVSSGQGKGLVLSPNVSPVSGASASTLPSSYTLCGNQAQDTSTPLEPMGVRTWLTTWKSRLPCAKGRSLDSAFSLENQGSAGEVQGKGRKGGAYMCATVLCRVSSSGSSLRTRIVLGT